MTRIAPSILSADFARLAEEIARVEAGGADLLHVDVMDGRFVPNITIGLPVVQSLKAATRLPLDVHLMIVEPDRYLARFVEAGAEVVHFHVEAEHHAHRAIQAVRDAGARVGIAINPATALASLEAVLDLVDVVLVMSVNPGFGGQRFITSSLDRVRQLADWRRDRGLAFAIEVDGGVGLDNRNALVEAGADILVAGSAVFQAEDPAATVRRLREGT